MSCAPVSKRISTRASESWGSACRIATVSSTSECDTVRDLAPYHRCRVTYSISERSSISVHLLFLPELEPEEAARCEREEVRQLADRRERRPAEHLDRHHAGVRGEVELHGLSRAGAVVDAQHDVLLPGADVGEDPRVLGALRLVGAQPEDGVLLAESDEALHPAEQRVRRAQLRLDVDRLEAVDGIHEGLEVELGPVGAREAGVAVARPLHRRAHAVPVAQVHVVAHAYLVPVIEDG